MGNYLKNPNTEKETEEKHGEKLSYAVCSMQGWRISMEDAHIVESNFDKDISLFCIFDGHGGGEAAQFSANHFGIELKKNQHYQRRNYKKALEETFQKIDELLVTKEGQKEINDIRKSDQGYSYAGCTALVVLIVGQKLYIANAGDCRSLLFDRTGKIFILNSEHKPNDVEEKRRITNGGAFIINGRINENLNLSRALGDLDYKNNKYLSYEDQIITGFPEVVEKDLSKDDVVLFMGCDGVFEKLNDIQLRDIVFESLIERENLLTPLKRILDETLAPCLNIGLNGYDNMSSILVKFNQNSN